MLDRSSRSCRRRRKMSWRGRSRRRRRSDQRGLLRKRQLSWRGGEGSGGGGGDVRGRNSVRTMGHGIWLGELQIVALTEAEGRMERQN